MVDGLARPETSLKKLIAGVAGEFPSRLTES
jgi:hypothetical protein